jgi:hypothetical protein
MKPAYPAVETLKDLAPVPRTFVPDRFPAVRGWDRTIISVCSHLWCGWASAPWADPCPAPGPVRGVPSLIFGRLPAASEPRRPLFLAFILFNLIALPIVGIALSRCFLHSSPEAPPPAYTSAASAVGQGNLAADPAVVYSGSWQSVIIPAELLGTSQDAEYRFTDQPGASYMLQYNGQVAQITYSSGPGGGIWAVQLDGKPLLDSEIGEPVSIDAYSPAIVMGSLQISASTPGVPACSGRTPRRKARQPGDRDECSRDQVFPHPGRQPGFNPGAAPAGEY